MGTIKKKNCWIYINYFLLIYIIMGKSKNKINLHGAIIIVFLLLALYFVLHIFTYCKEGYTGDDNSGDDYGGSVVVLVTVVAVLVVLMIVVMVGIVVVLRLAWLWWWKLRWLHV